MVQSYGTDSVEKVTFNMPASLKEKVNLLKEELHLSFSTIYNEAIAEYIQKKELEKWEKGVASALNDSEYLSEISGSDDGELYEY